MMSLLLLLLLLLVAEKQLQTSHWILNQRTKDVARRYKRIVVASSVCSLSFLSVAATSLGDMDVME